MALPRTACIIGVEMACGDAAEQRLESSSSSWDMQRSARLGLTGVLMTGPLAHCLFQGLERMAPGTSFNAVARKVAGNSLFMPVMIGATLSTAWLFEGRTAREIRASLDRELWPSVGAGLLFWPIVNVGIFRFVPMHARPAVSSGFGGLWGVFLSARANATQPLLVDGAPLVPLVRRISRACTDPT